MHSNNSSLVKVSEKIQRISFTRAVYIIEAERNGILIDDHEMMTESNKEVKLFL